MKLIGMLDSPFVRRTAISFDLLGIPFEHDALSVFSTFEEFQSINPVVKAPTLICDNGDVLMDSNLIIQYGESLTVNKTLLPEEHSEKQTAFKIIGLALAACEKSVQIVYEHNLRPEEKQYKPWLTRVSGQLNAAYKGLEEIYITKDFKTLTQDNITAAIAWNFTQIIAPGVIDPDMFPHLVKLSSWLESQPVFEKYPPLGPGVSPND